MQESYFLNQQALMTAKYLVSFFESEVDFILKMEIEVVLMITPFLFSYALGD